MLGEHDRLWNECTIGQIGAALSGHIFKQHPQLVSKTISVPGHEFNSHQESQRTSWTKAKTKEQIARKQNKHFKPALMLTLISSWNYTERESHISYQVREHNFEENK